MKAPFLQILTCKSIQLSILKINSYTFKCLHTSLYETKTLTQTRFFFYVYKHFYSESKVKKYIILHQCVDVVSFYLGKKLHSQSSKNTFKNK